MNEYFKTRFWKQLLAIAYLELAFEGVTEHIGS